MASDRYGASAVGAAATLRPLYGALCRVTLYEHLEDRDNATPSIYQTTKIRECFHGGSRRVVRGMKPADGQEPGAEPGVSGGSNLPPCISEQAAGSRRVNDAIRRHEIKPTIS